MLFLLATFHLTLFVQSLLDGDFGITPVRAVSATIGALVVAKCMLIASKLPLTHLFRGRALILPILWRTMVYGALVLAFKIVERLVPIVREHGLPGAWGRLKDETHWGHFWAVFITLASLLALYCTLEEAARIIGVDRCLELFLGIRRKPGRSRGPGAREG
jgi:hypothetical protein